MTVLMLRNLIPKLYSYYKYFIREYHFYFQGLGLSGWRIWCFLWVYWSMGLRLGLFYAGVLVWVLRRFHPRGLGVGLSVSSGLRYRLLWFWVFRWVFPFRVEE